MNPLNVYRVTGDLQYGNIFLNLEKKGPNYIRDVDVVKKEEWNIYPCQISKYTYDVDVIIFASSYFVVNEKTKSILEPYCKNIVDFLPVQLGERTYWFMKSYVFYDCTVREKMEGDKNTVPHFYWSYINRFAFDSEKIEKSPFIFRCLEKKTYILCTDQFKDLVEGAGIVGFKFEHLWNSETGGIWCEREPIFGPEGAKLNRELKENWGINKKKYGLLNHVLKQKVEILK
ncbi:hypothetical protein ACI01nite_14330 [Acetobacter cibinongensis]|uniref:Uncharacterized protein n=1 Tax=Acetobacter cibinongensis TaxID=146475 RepID=A0A0D6N546_9PROT|nr:hypothetical protein [Acetobacter cibinongensis]GAN60800.1 hypothetical protein Abci_016_146 [Acetobacter cibinongensis]GBQ12210.1 hypothetical protein AA0482_0185 [Acetobacter cibinongensis NRIC 0482]GEL58831.1 hypothetical protein ACI01nite_14330 [Acetobacter cibinongensis]